MDDPTAEFLAKEREALSKLETNTVLMDNLHLERTQNNCSNNETIEKILDQPKSPIQNYKEETINLWEIEYKDRKDKKDEIEQEEYNKLLKNAEKEREEYYKSCQQISMKFQKDDLNNSFSSQENDFSIQDWNKISEFCNFSNNSKSNESSKQRMKNVILSLKEQFIVSR